jgi:hypothetical protein
VRERVGDERLDVCGGSFVDERPLLHAVGEAVADGKSVSGSLMQLRASTRYMASLQD